MNLIVRLFIRSVVCVRCCVRFLFVCLLVWLVVRLFDVVLVCVVSCVHVSFWCCVLYV